MINAGVFRGQIWDLLAGQVKAEDVDPAVIKEVAGIETWILRFLCAPVPVPGKTRLQVCFYRARNKFFYFLFFFIDHFIE